MTIFHRNIGLPNDIILEINFQARVNRAVIEMKKVI